MCSFSWMSEAMDLKKEKDASDSSLCVSNWEFSRRIQDSATLLGARCLAYADPHMRNLVLVLQLAVVTAKLCGSGSVRAVMWSVDLFRCESIVLRSYWVLVVVDQFTRRLVGIRVHRGAVTDADLCCMFNAATHCNRATNRLSSGEGST